MEKEILVLTSVFLLIAVIHLIYLKIIRTSEEKKKHLRTIFFCIYGVAFTIIGAI